jgi:hypothetical protein
MLTKLRSHLWVEHRNTGAPQELLRQAGAPTPAQEAAEQPSLPSPPAAADAQRPAGGSGALLGGGASAESGVSLAGRGSEPDPGQAWALPLAAAGIGVAAALLAAAALGGVLLAVYATRRHPQRRLCSLDSMELGQGAAIRLRAAAAAAGKRSPGSSGGSGRQGRPSSPEPGLFATPIAARTAPGRAADRARSAPAVPARHEPGLAAPPQAPVQARTLEQLPGPSSSTRPSADALVPAPSGLGSLTLGALPVNWPQRPTAPGPLSADPAPERIRARPPAAPARAPTRGVAGRGRGAGSLDGARAARPAAALPAAPQGLAGCWSSPAGARGRSSAPAKPAGSGGVPAPGGAGMRGDSGVGARAPDELDEWQLGPRMDGSHGVQAPHGLRVLPPSPFTALTMFPFAD